MRTVWNWTLIGVLGGLAMLAFGLDAILQSMRRRVS
jgi:hypothetical protein